jgi:hypothetical protein
MVSGGQKQRWLALLDGTLATPLSLTVVNAVDFGRRPGF